MVMLGFEPRIQDSKSYVLTTTLHDLLILNLISHTGTRTRVCWVKASYPNRLDYVGLNRTHTCNVLSTSCGTRTRNLRFRRPARYPIALMRQLAAGGFDPPTFGLWARHASSAPRCYWFMWGILSLLKINWKKHTSNFFLTPPHNIL